MDTPKHSPGLILVSNTATQSAQADEAQTASGAPAAQEWAEFEALTHQALRARGWPAPLRQQLLAWYRVRCGCDVHKLDTAAPRPVVAEVFRALLDGRPTPYAEPYQ